MSLSNCFAVHFAAAREKFIRASCAVGARVESYLHPRRGPDGGELAVDVACVGGSDADRILIVLSGTHGIEGFAGSAAQVGWLESGRARVNRRDVAVILIHAVNPYGFAWLRRVDESNVDLNRNFVDHSKPYPANPAYDDLASAVCPAELTPASLRACKLALQAYGAAHGERALYRAVSGGQYRHPQGLFFGGNEPSWSNQVMTSMMQDRVSQAKHVALIDIHTGIGSYGEAQAISRHAPPSTAFERLQTWYGAIATDQFLPDGHIALAVERAARRAEYTAINLEFGTRPMERVFDALQAENWLHWQGDPVSQEGKDIKAQILDAFCPDEDQWKTHVCRKSMDVIETTLAHLAAGEWRRNTAQ
jgi:hypothetical protein